MSQANVELVRGIYEAVARHDGVTPFERYADDIVWDFTNTQRAALYSRSVYHGHEGVREMWREALAAFDDVDFEVESLIDAGERVLAVARDRMVGRSSRAPAEAVHYAVWTIAGGKVVRLQAFDDRARALEAAGLRSDAA